MRFESTRDELVYLCSCKQTKRPPFCDGSHNAEDLLPDRS